MKGFAQFLLITGLGAVFGCGSEVPEGYVPVRIKTGSSIPLNPLVMQVGVNALCDIPALKLTVLGPGIDPPIQVPIAGQVDITNFLSAVVGSDVMTPIDIKVVVPKGPDRVFLLNGVFHESCSSGSKSYPIYGIAGPVYLDKPVTFPLDAVAVSNGGNGLVFTTPVTIDVGDKLTEATIQWNVGTNPLPATIYVIDPVSGVTLSPPLGYSLTSGSSFDLGPIIPNRKYVLIVNGSGGLMKFVFEAPPAPGGTVVLTTANLIP